MEGVSLYFFHSNFFVLQLPVARMHVDRLSLSVNTFSWERCVGVCVRECIRHYLLYVWCTQSCWFKLTKSFAMRQAFFIQKHTHTHKRFYNHITHTPACIRMCTHVYIHTHTDIYLQTLNNCHRQKERLFVKCKTYHENNEASQFNAGYLYVYVCVHEPMLGVPYLS